MSENVALLSLDDQRFFLLKGKTSVDPKIAFTEALAEAKADKVRANIEDLPQKYLDKHDIEILPISCGVLTLCDEKIYGGMADDLGIELAKCCHCDHCDGSYCFRYGTIDPNNEACERCVSDCCWWLAYDKNDGEREYLSLFYCSNNTLDNELNSPSEEIIRKIVDALADSDEGLAFDIQNIPDDCVFVIEHS